VPADEKGFAAMLDAFLKGRNKYHYPVIIDGAEISFRKLYKSVTERGGLKAINSKGAWKEVLEALELQKIENAEKAEAAIREAYEIQLQSFEWEFFLQREGDCPPEVERPKAIAPPSNPQPKNFIVLDSASGLTNEEEAVVKRKRKATDNLEASEDFRKEINSINSDYAAKRISRKRLVQLKLAAAERFTL